MNNTEALKQRLDGTIILPGNPGYDEARSIWNGMIDRKPAVIVRCRTEADVTHAVKYARENQLVVAIRGGGHNIAGYAVCDGGLMIDLSAMKEVRVNAPARRAYVQPGATLFDVDRGTQPHNHTGIGWTSLVHTSDFVPIVALGPGAERFRGFLQNVDVFGHYTQLTGVDFRNPSLPLERAGAV